MSQACFRLCVVPLLCVFLLSTSVIPAVNAAVIDTATYLETSQLPTKETLQMYLERDEVRQQLREYGVDPVAAQTRIAQMSDSEVRLLHKRLDQLPAGANFFAVLGIVLVVLIVLEILGVTNVFTRL